MYLLVSSMDWQHWSSCTCVVMHHSLVQPPLRCRYMLGNPGLRPSYNATRRWFAPMPSHSMVFFQHEPCPPGTFCEGLRSCKTCKECPPGYVCPANSSVRTACAPGEFCPGGLATPQPCPAGFYCRIPTAKEPCGAGYFCPVMSTVRKECPGGFWCAEGSSSPSPCTACAWDISIFACKSATDAVCLLPSSYVWWYVSFTAIALGLSVAAAVICRPQQPLSETEMRAMGN